MELTFLCTILAVFHFTTVNPKILIKKLSFDGCKNDSWRVIDITLVPFEDRINVVADIAYGNKPINVIHQVRLNLTGCSENFKCTNHTDIVIGDFKCGVNVTELDKEACDVAETLAQWQLEAGELNENETKSNLEDGCIHYDTKLVNQEVIDTINIKDTVKIYDQDPSRFVESVAKLNFTSFP